MKLVQDRMMIEILLLSALLAIFFWPGNALGQAAALQDLGEHWAQEAIANLHSQGIVGGVEEGLFKPDERASRGEVAVCLVRALGLAQHVPVLAQVKPSFQDVPQGHWAHGYIEVAREYSLLQGQGENRFGIEQGMSREELAVLLVRSLDLWSGDQLSQPGGAGRKLARVFGDHFQISAWAREEVWRAVELGLVKGFPDGSFRPQEPVTRAEMAQLLENFLVLTGRGYQFHGLVQGGDPGLDRLEIMVNDRLHFFQVAGDAVFFDRGQEKSWQELLIFTPVYFNLNQQGEINFLLAADRHHPAAEFAVVAMQLEEGPGRGSRQPVQARQAGGQGKLRESGSHHGAGEELGGVPLATTPEVTGRLMRAGQLRSQLGVSGKGVKVAIVDSGVDPGHPDLLANSDGTPKLVQLVDVTGEGLVATVGEQVKIGRLTLPGFWVEDLLVVLLERSPGHYLTYVAPPGDEELLRRLVRAGEEAFGRQLEAWIAAGEVEVLAGKGFPVYSSPDDVIPVPLETGVVNLAVAGTAPDGSWVQFFFDGNGHGTHVAGIVGANGMVKGIAPDAELVIIKALDWLGESDVPTIKKGIEKAVAIGAQLVNLSLGYQVADRDLGHDLVAFIQQLSKEHGVTFVVAAGNQGPGIGSLATPGNGAAVITVGAYISPEIWQSAYGLNLAGDRLHGFSAVGPGGEHGIKPDVLAPGLVESTYPLWSRTGYQLDEGTSMAVAHVTGLLALILEAGGRQRLELSPGSLQLALQQGAGKMAGLTYLEQGYGRVDGWASWLQLQEIVANRLSQPSEKLKLAYVLGGEQLGYLSARDFVPGILQLALGNNSAEEMLVELVTDVDWLQPELASLRLPAGTTRTVPVAFRQVQDQRAEQGARVGLLTAATSGEQVDLVNLVITPVDLAAGPVTKEGRLAAGSFARYFLPVAEDTAGLSVSLRILTGPGGTPQGRARLHLFDPGGLEWEVTPFVGAGATGPGSRWAETIHVESPDPGVWELVVASSPWLDAYGLADSRYIVTMHREAAAENSQPVQLAVPAEGWAIGVMPPGETKVALDRQVLWLFNSSTGQFYQGMALINHSLYQVEGGRVQIHAQHLDREQITIQLLDY